MNIFWLTSSVTFTTLATTLAIGVSKTSSPNTYFSGKIDEPALWSSDLLSADVVSIYHSGVSMDLTGLSGLSSWWRMGDASGDDLPVTGVVIDQIGSRNLSASGFLGVIPAADAP